jgi:hypothetical protein
MCPLVPSRFFAPPHDLNFRATSAFGAENGCPSLSLQCLTVSECIGVILTQFPLVLTAVNCVASGARRLLPSTPTNWTWKDFAGEGRR